MEFSYSCFIVTILTTALKRTVLSEELETDRQTDGRTAASLKAPDYGGRGGNLKRLLTSCVRWNKAAHMYRRFGRAETVF